jgi:hypothetical protein
MSYETMSFRNEVGIYFSAIANGDSNIYILPFDF